MYKTIHLYLASIFFWMGISVHAQEDTVAVAETHSPLPLVIPKPRVDLGIGTFTFYGDVGRNNAGYAIGTSDFATRLKLIFPLSPSFDVSFYTLFGTVHVREFGLEQPLNFQSRIGLAATEVSYNFQHFFDKKPTLQPFVSVGFSAMEFLTKSDMLDAEGNPYYHWADGTVRNLPESSFNAVQADIVNYDNVYETDIRELQEGEFGKYPERTFAIPLTLGANLRLTERFHTQLSGTYFLSFSDLIDNVGSSQERNTANLDKFLYLGISLNYDLSITPKALPELINFSEEGGNATAYLDWDGDKDGVHDLEDECLDTPEGVEVDAKGCALDSDGDGVADYKDAEPDTEQGMPVNADGVGITDEDFYAQYLYWIDSIPYSQWKQQFASVHVDPEHAKRFYTVKVGTENDNMSQEQINSILSLEDVEILDQPEGKVYVAGKFENLPEAVERKLALEKQGLEGQIKSADTEKNTLESPNDKLAALEKQIRKEHIPSESTEENTVYRVQIGAFQNNVNSAVFYGVPNILVLKGTDGLTRFSTGSFNTIEDAAKLKMEMFMLGYTDSFIASYRNGERVSLKSSGVALVAGADDPVTDFEFSSIDASQIEFEVEVGAFEGDIPTATLDKFLKLGSVSPRKDAKGIMHYVVTGLSNKAEAEKVLSKAKSLGLKDAEIKGNFKGRMISLQEAEYLMDAK